MKDTIYLACSRNKVEKITKTPTEVRRGEISVKLNVEVEESNFSPPFIVKDIQVAPWDKDIDVKDVDFEGNYVTEDEAKLIRASRLERMKDILEQQGYEVSKKEE